MFVRRGSWEVCDGKESCQMPCVHRRRRTASRMDLAKTIWFAKTWTILWDVICGIIWPQRWRHTNRKTYLVIWRCHIWVQLPYESLLCLKQTITYLCCNKGKQRHPEQHILTSACESFSEPPLICPREHQSSLLLRLQVYCLASPENHSFSGRHPNQ